MRNGMTPLVFKAFGIGGAGCNFIARTRFPSLAIGTNLYDLERCPNARKIVMSVGEIVGFAETDQSVLTINTIPSMVRECFRDNDVSALIAGLGGITGSNGIRLFATASKISEKTTICIVSIPFTAEGELRRKIALTALEDLKRRSDFIICFENDKLRDLVPQMPINKAFNIMNAIMERPIIDLSNVMVASDNPVFKQIAQRSATFRLGVGLGKGRLRDFVALKEAFESPWFDFNLDSALSAFAIISSNHTDEKELDDVIREIHKKLPNCKLMIGSYEDPSLGDRLRVTLLIGKPLSLEE